MTTETTADLQPVFPDSKATTHMPFFDGTTLLFCQADEPIEHTQVTQNYVSKHLLRHPVFSERFKALAQPKSQTIRYRAWKLAYCNWTNKIIHPIVTGLPDNAIECSPSLYSENGNVHVSFIAGVPSDKGIHYRLYTCSGSDLAHLSPAEALPYRPVFFGFVSLYHICWGARNVINLTEKASGRTFQFKTTFARVLRVTFLADRPEKLLITGSDEERRFRTVLYDLQTDNNSEVTAEGSIYKSSIQGDRVVFAKKRGDGFENRELHHGSYQLSSSTVQILKGN